MARVPALRPRPSEGVVSAEADGSVPPQFEDAFLPSNNGVSPSASATTQGLKAEDIDWTLDHQRRITRLARSAWMRYADRRAFRITSAIRYAAATFSRW